MMVVSPAICGTVIGRFGTEEQKQRWLPGARRRLDDHGLRDHRARRRLELARDHHRGPPGRRRVGAHRARRCWISGVDEADALLVVGRLADGAERARCGLRCSSSRPTPRADRAPDPDGDRQPGAAVPAVPRRRPAAGRRARRRTPTRASRSCSPASTRSGSWRRPTRSASPGYAHAQGRRLRADPRRSGARPIGAHQGLAHPLAACQIQIECARLMTQKAAWLIDAGAGRRAGRQHAPSTPRPRPPCTPSTRRSRPTAATASSQEYGVARAAGASSRLSRIAPVSREMILNFVAQHDLQLPRSY